MKFWHVYLILCIFTFLLACMGSTSFQFTTEQVLQSTSSRESPETLFPDNPVMEVTDKIIDERNSRCIVNPGINRWVAPFGSNVSDSHRWIKLSTHINAEFIDLDLTNDQPPIFASWFELPDGSRCEASPLELDPNEPTDLTAKSLRYIDPRIATFAFSYTIFTRSHEGKFEFSDTVVEVVAISSQYTLGMSVTLGLLIFFIAVLMFKNRQAYSPPVVFSLFIVNLIIVALMLTSSDKIVSAVGLAMRTLGIQAENNVQHYFTIAHAVVFALSTALLLALKSKTGLTLVRSLALMLLLAILSEVFQMHVSSRSSSLEDLQYDIIGIVIGSLLYCVFFYSVKVCNDNFKAPSNQ